MWENQKTCVRACKHDRIPNPECFYTHARRVLAYPPVFFDFPACGGRDGVTTTGRAMFAWQMASILSSSENNNIRLYAQWAAFVFTGRSDAKEASEQVGRAIHLRVLQRSASKRSFFHLPMVKSSVLLWDLCSSPFLLLRVQEVFARYLTIWERLCIIFASTSHIGFDRSGLLTKPQKT